MAWCKPLIGIYFEALGASSRQAPAITGYFKKTPPQQPHKNPKPGNSLWLDSQPFFLKSDNAVPDGDLTVTPVLSGNESEIMEVSPSNQHTAPLRVSCYFCQEEMCPGYNRDNPQAHPCP